MVDLLAVEPYALMLSKRDVEMARTINSDEIYRVYDMRFR
jgi:hypothetical protein